MDNLIESLSPNERKILPHIKENTVGSISEKSGLDKVSVLRALEYLQNKDLVKISIQKKKVIEIGVNGALYKKKGLPERRVLNILGEKRILSLKEAQKLSSLNNDEFKASIGVLKKKALIELKNGKLSLNAKPEEISKKTLEEIFIGSLPLELSKLSPEQNHAFNSLKSRKNMVEIVDKKEINLEVTPKGGEASNLDFSSSDFIEQITPKILSDEKLWKRKKFRRYDLTSPVPSIYGGKRHFVNQSIDYARKIWTDMGFEEMTGNLVQSSFWNFDALFTAQDHPVREMQDTFYLDKKLKGNFPKNKKLINSIKKSHESGVGGSKGWGGNWDEKESERLVLRTHTTCLSSKTLSKINPKELPKKFFAIGKCFRNETVDWSHGFEFNQTEGIVVDENANFRHLLGYLRQFFQKMGFEKVRFRPAYFPYTEPSVEIDVFHPEKKTWLELGGAGIFRPEVTIPLLGKPIPVLAWGPGFDRTLMDYYGIKDLRELYKNNISQLRKIKFWMKS